MPKRARVIFAESSSSSSDDSDDDAQPTRASVSVPAVPSGNAAKFKARAPPLLPLPAPAASLAAKSKVVKNPVVERAMMKSAIQPGFERVPISEAAVVAKRQLKKLRKAERERTKGDEWFHLPATDMTDERKNDLELLNIRNSLDPKRFYKGGASAPIPKYFQVGTIIEHKADFYSSRVPKKDRKRTIVEEILADEELKSYNKAKYADIQKRDHTRRRGAFRKQSGRNVRRKT